MLAKHATQESYSPAMKEILLECSTGIRRRNHTLD